MGNLITTNRPFAGVDHMTDFSIATPCWLASYFPFCMATSYYLCIEACFSIAFKVILRLIIILFFYNCNLLLSVLSIREIKTSSKLAYIRLNSHQNHSLLSTDNKILELWKKRIMIISKIFSNAFEKTRFNTKITAGCHANRK